LLGESKSRGKSFVREENGKIGGEVKNRRKICQGCSLPSEKLGRIKNIGGVLLKVHIKK